VSQVGRLAEAAIVGAALINRIDAAPADLRVAAVESFIAELRPARLATT
jgi:tryptophan synthase alpha subunit